MSINDGGPAFPQTSTSIIITGDGTPVPDVSSCGGMMLRDWFAGKALTGLLSDGEGRPEEPGDIASAAYLMADLMLAERAKAFAT